MASRDKIRKLQPRVQAAAQSLRPTRAEVDLAAVSHNLGVVREVAGSARVLAVVKADAYGHGVAPVAARLQSEGVVGFGVALAEEGLELRDAGIDAEILVLNGVYGGAHEAVIRRGLTPVVYDLGEIEAFHRAAQGDAFSFHLKVDTGMSRLGVPLRELESFLRGLARFPGAKVEGLMTHLAAADNDESFTHEQLQGFQRARHLVRRYGHSPSVLHTANSAATFRHPSARYSWVRPGIALFGYSGVSGLEAGLRPAMRLRSEVIALREIPVGASVGYDRSFKAERTTRVATIPLGYGDGLMRRTSNRGEVLVRGCRCPIIGKVSMDLTAIDVTDVPVAVLGDEVVLLGRQGDECISADELARSADTVLYEVLTNVSRRVPRFVR